MLMILGGFVIYVRMLVELPLPRVNLVVLVHAKILQYKAMQEVKEHVSSSVMLENVRLIFHVVDAIVDQVCHYECP